MNLKSIMWLMWFLNALVKELLCLFAFVLFFFEVLSKWIFFEVTYLFRSNITAILLFVTFS